MKKITVSGRKKEITVIGGGLAGLTAAIILARDFRAFTAGFAAKFARRERFVKLSYLSRSVMTRAGLLAMRIKCALNTDFASKSREPLRWFRGM